MTTEETYEGAKARVWENRVMIKWVGQALRYRITAYKKALDGLEIETPTQNRVWKVNNAIRELEGPGSDRGSRLRSEHARRSRIFEQHRYQTVYSDLQELEHRAVRPVQK